MRPTNSLFLLGSYLHLLSWTGGYSGALGEPSTDPPKKGRGPAKTKSPEERLGASPPPAAELDVDADGRQRRPSVETPTDGNNKPRERESRTPHRKEAAKPGKKAIAVEEPKDAQRRRHSGAANKRMRGAPPPKDAQRSCGRQMRHSGAANKRMRGAQPPKDAQRSSGAADKPNKPPKAELAYPITERDLPITYRLQINVETSRFPNRSPTELPARFYRGIVVEKPAEAPKKYTVVWLSNERNPNPEAIPEKSVYSKAEIVKYMGENPVTTDCTQEQWTAFLEGDVPSPFDPLA